MGPNGGRTNSFAEDAVREAISKLSPDQITADLNAAADYGLKLPASSGKLFVAGFCWGGSQTFRFATNRADLAGAFVFYGGPPEKDAMARIKAPVYGFYAGNDARIDATIPDTVTAMKAAGKTYDPVTYDGAGHGFMRAGEAPDASDANKKARDQAFSKMTGIINAGAASLAQPAHGSSVTAKAARNAQTSSAAVKTVSAKQSTSDAMDCHDMEADSL